MTDAYNGRQVAGMDLHRRRGVLVRTSQDGRKLETARIADSPAALRTVIARAGRNPRTCSRLEEADAKPTSWLTPDGRWATRSA